jgi:threonine aldolase
MNNLAKYFEQELIKIDKSAIAYPVQTNMVFLKMKQELFGKLITTASFYRWDNDMEEVRIVFFNTTIGVAFQVYLIRLKIILLLHFF